ncbi:hypothetical protein KP509_1Z288900 [Ceratopteris richardii]|nr:hypothetical protein KP509_1Z288900 [Ceratopteris richardii]
MFKSSNFSFNFIPELQEEAVIIAGNIKKQGLLTFHFDDKPQPWEVSHISALNFECFNHVFHRL